MAKAVFGNVTVDSDQYRAVVGGVSVELTFMQFEVLSQLAEHAGHVVTRSELSARLWPGQPVRVGDRRIDIQVCRLRQKLHGSAPWRIATVTRRGYVFTDEARPGRERA